MLHVIKYVKQLEDSWKDRKQTNKKKETGASILIKEFFFFLCIFYRAGEAIQLSMKSPKTFLWPFLWKCGVGWMVMAPFSGWKASQHFANRSFSPIWDQGRKQTVDWITLRTLRQRCHIHDNPHCARPIPGHGYDRTLFHWGVSVASFHILLNQWFLCAVVAGKKKKAGWGWKYYPRMM